MAATDTWAGRPVLDRDGGNAGTVQDVYLERATREPAFALISNGHPAAPETRFTIVPLVGAGEHDGALVLGVGGGAIVQAPAAAPGEVLTPEREQLIYAHYGIHPPAPPAAEEMTRSEEQLVVDKRPVAREQVRVRKHVVEEEVTVTVSLRREELRIEREPIADGDAVDLGPSASIGETETTFFLLAEEPVVGKRVVPVERVVLHKDLVSEEQSVSEQVRRERIDVEHESP